MLCGHVIDDVSGQPVSHVAVSNGRDVVQTDGAGRYRLHQPTQATHGERFVTMTTPSGYRPVGGWFRDLRSDPHADLTFHLAPDAIRGGNTFSFAQITDLHVGAYPAEWLIEDLDAIVNDHAPQCGPVHCIISTGDATQSGKPEQFDAYLRACSGCPVPIIQVPGNHDWATDKSGQTWADMIGPLYFSFDWGPVHAIAYESTARRYVPEMPLNEWFAADLAVVPPERLIVLLVHDQLEEEFCARWRDRRIVATVSGHWHTSRLYDDGHTLHFNQPTTLVGGIDYSARGYTAYTVRSDGNVLATRRLLGACARAKQTGVASVSKLPTRKPEPAAPEVSLGREWPQFHGGPSRDGVSHGTLGFPLVRKWQTRLPGGLLFGSPVIAHGSVFIAVLDEERHTGGSVVALDAVTGEIRWRKPTFGSAKHTPAIWEDVVVVMTITGQVAGSEHLTGETVWVYQLGDPSTRWIFSAPLVAGNRVYAGHARHFVALDARTGERIWLRDDLDAKGRGDWISSYCSPAADETTVYIGFFWHEESLWALDRANGETRWVVRGPRGDYGPASSPVLDGDGSVYVICHDAKVRAYDVLTGALRWEFDLQHEKGRRGGPAWSAGTPALARAAGGMILHVPTGDGALRTVEAATGTEVWHWWSGESLAGIQAYARDGRSILSSPAVVGNQVLFGTSDGRIVALDCASGRLVWSDDLRAPVVSSPAVSGNLVVCGASDGWLYAWTGERF